MLLGISNHFSNKKILYNNNNNNNILDLPCICSL